MNAQLTSSVELNNLLLTTSQQQHERRSVLLPSEESSATVSPPDSPESSTSAGHSHRQPFWPFFAPQTTPSAMFPFGFPASAATPSNISTINNNNVPGTLPNNFFTSLYFSSLMKAMQATEIGTPATRNNIVGGGVGLSMPQRFDSNIARQLPPPPPPPSTLPLMDPRRFTLNMLPNLYGQSQPTFWPSNNNSNNNNEACNALNSVSRASDPMTRSVSGSTRNVQQDDQQQRKSRFTQMKRALDMTRMASNIENSSILSPIEGKKYALN